MRSQNQGLGSNKSVRSLFNFNNNVYAGIGTLGAWKRSAEITAIQSISSELPAHYLLEQNYPNPFNPATSIKFSITNSSNVKIIIFDVAGKEIETLVNEELQAGTYQTTWNASAYTSGVYFYTLESQNFKESKKMLLVK